MKICDISPFIELIQLQNEWCGYFKNLYQNNIVNPDCGYFKDRYNNNTENPDCGYFKNLYQNNCIEISDENMTEGSIINGRTACQHPVYEKMIWHTHPITSKPYPSREDVLKVLKHKIPELSIIATRWGIWQIKFTGSVNLDIEGEKKIINEFEKIIYENTERGRVPQISNENMEFINRYIYKLITRYPGLEIRFDRWEDLYENNLFVI